jgi:hypothetical protein
MKQTERGPIYGPRARSLGGTGDCSSPAAAAPAEQLLPSSRPHMPAVRLIPKAIPKGYTQRLCLWGRWPHGGQCCCSVAVGSCGRRFGVPVRSRYVRARCTLSVHHSRERTRRALSR